MGKPLMRVIAGLGALVVLGAMGLLAKSVLSGDVRPTGERLKQAPYYHVAAQQISLDPDVLAALGQPLEFGAVELKRATGDDDQGTVVLDLQVKGPKGAGHGQVEVAKQDEKHGWVSRGGDFFLASGRPIRLLPR